MDNILRPVILELQKREESRMGAPQNRFKAAITAGQPQIGLWLSLTSPIVAEMLGGCGYDWLLIDGEHAPNDLQTFMGQLQALRGSTATPIIRLPAGEPWMIKQALDLGAQTLMIPMVESAEQARQLVRAMRYPPHGFRGMAGLMRASDYGNTPDYIATANEQVCLLVQVETRKGLEALDEICAVEGVDGVFIGPADLSADLGYPGNPRAPEAVAAIEGALERITSHGKAPGILAVGGADPARYLQLGARFVALGLDIGLLRQGALALRKTVD